MFKDFKTLDMRLQTSIFNHQASKRDACYEEEWKTSCSCRCVSTALSQRASSLSHLLPFTLYFCLWQPFYHRIIILPIFFPSVFIPHLIHFTWRASFPFQILPSLPCNNNMAFVLPYLSNVTSSIHSKKSHVVLLFFYFKSLLINSWH
jgi:hypothetical protein